MIMMQRKGHFSNSPNFQTINYIYSMYLVDFMPTTDNNAL
jgi:hypothetical protein